MNTGRDSRGIASSRERIAELRERRRRGTLDQLSSSRTTVIINMLIGVTSGIIFLVGITVAVRFLAFQRESMGETSYRLFTGIFLLVGVFWLAFLVVRIRGHLSRLSDISAEARAAAGQRPRSETD